MRSLRFVPAVTILLITMLLAQSASLLNPPAAHQDAASARPKPNPAAQEKIAENYGKLPLAFEVNHGQTDLQVKFLSRTSAYSLFLTGDEAVLTFPAKKDRFSPSGRSSAADAPTRVLRMKLRNANSSAKVTGVDKQAGKSNYFVGNDPAKWQANVPTYATVKYEGIYNGIDLVYYGNQRQLEYDFIVAPGADPQRIAFTVSGAKRIRQNAQGELIFKMGAGTDKDEIRWHKPVVYQEKNGAREEIAAHYTITDKSRIGFELAKYDASRLLYIDPLIYSTYLGGGGSDQGNGIALDSAGNAYVTGQTSSTDFPTENPLQPANGGGTNGTAFVTKINATGSALIYSTYLGGSGSDAGQAIAVDSGGSAYIAGTTSSTNFPTMNPLQPTNNGTQNAFVTKINPSGSALIYSTYLGGSGIDGASGIAVDSAGDAYVTGDTSSTNFPTMNPLQATYGGNGDAFVAKINPAGSAFVYSTYLGGSGDDSGSAIAVDSAGNTYVTGATVSADFPITPGTIETAIDCAANNEGCGNAFVTKVNPEGSALVYSTYLSGGDGGEGSGIAADGAGNAYVSGTLYTPTYGRHGILNFKINKTAFEYKINSTGSAFVYANFPFVSTYGFGTGIAVDSSGSAYVIGTAVTYYEQELYAYVVRINPTGSTVGAPTHIGNANGIAVDNVGNAYVTGSTDGTKFTTKNPLQATFGGGSSDAFVSKIDMRVATKTTLSSSPNPSTDGQVVTFTAMVNSSLSAPPDGETVSFMKGKAVLGTGTLSGGTATFTTSSLPVGTTSIQAVYGGDANLAGSRSVAVKQVVNKAAE